MPKIKICGLKRPEDIISVNDARPDYVGFVFAPGRKRTVSLDKGKSLRSGLSDEIKAVGVFMGNGFDEIITAAERGIIDLIQLHEYAPEFVSELKKKVSIPIISAVSVRNTIDIINADNMMPADYLLLDNFKPGITGGTGESFNWEMIPALSKPFFLAGGINADNIRSSMKYRAYCIDISSGAETNGYKDEKKIKELVRIIRSE